MRIDIVSIFPGMFTALDESIVRRAVNDQLVQLQVVDLRNYSTDKHHSVDDYPYGGGPGMVMQPEPFFRAVEHLKSIDPRPGRVILLCPQGEPFCQQKAGKLAKLDRLILLCGHYEGVDQRIRDELVDEEISVGDFVMTGGEIPAMAVTDAVVRLLPGVLPVESVQDESFSDGLLEFPQYTRPADFRGLQVPPVLLSGNHERIRLWRREQALLRTLRCRPELLRKVELTPAERELLRAATAREGRPPEL